MAILSSIVSIEVAPTPQSSWSSNNYFKIYLEELAPYYKDILTKAQALYNDRVADPGR